MAVVCITLQCSGDQRTAVEQVLIFCLVETKYAASAFQCTFVCISGPWVVPAFTFPGQLDYRGLTVVRIIVCCNIAP